MVSSHLMRQLLLQVGCALLLAPAAEGLHQALRGPMSASGRGAAAAVAAAPGPAREPLLFLLDRDGVINKDVGSPGVVSPDALELLPGAATAIARLRGEGHFVCVCTNQSAVGKGAMSESALREVHSKMVAEVEAAGGWFDHIFVCCETEAQADISGSGRRKPHPGMLLEGMSATRTHDPSRCVFIGDTLSDMAAAAAARVGRRILVTSSHHGAAAAAAAASGDATAAAAGAGPDYFNFEVQPDLAAAVEAVLGAPLSRNLSQDVAAAAPLLG